MHLVSPTITGVILAGGRARRMNGVDKGLLEFAGKPLVEHTLARLTPQVSEVMINTNRNHARYASYGLTLVADKLEGYCGPLAGMHSAMCAAQTDYIVTAPCDSPLIPNDLAQRMMMTLMRESAELCTAHDGMRLQPIYTMIPRALATDLHSYLMSGGRKVENWLRRHRLAVADFSDQPEAFLNINTPYDHQLCEERAKNQHARV
ncbi:MAG TPA: molybdenum cofactor guanylyltransferase MobA [Gammaproteobacteria bacterium]|nr:molybdenum cofactor guanylyltransferase MobA [Gammaproteobacteria bacterium]